MTTFEELDQLSSQELHDRAMERAQKHLDVRFFWRLLNTIPEAEAAAGELDEADEDIERPRALLFSTLDADKDGKVLDALRPLYIDYLLKA